MKKTIRILAITALVAVIGFGVIACGGDDENGGGTPQKVTYVSTDNNGNKYTLEIDESGGRSARSAAQAGDTFKLTVEYSTTVGGGDLKMTFEYSGTVGAAQASGTRVSLMLDINGETITITIVGAQMTVITGRIVNNNGQEVVNNPGNVTPDNGTPVNPGPSSGAYVITGSGTSFTATRNGTTVPGADGKPIADVITAIRTNAAGAACEIQFGSGSQLNIGGNSITFTNDGGTWGAITLKGNLKKSSGYGTNNAAIIMEGPSITSHADISGHESGIRNNGNGTLTIADGTVTFGWNSYDARGIINDGGGTLTITGGTVSAPGQYGRAVSNVGTGTVNITGGTVSSGGTTTNSAYRAWAIYSNSTGEVNISGGTVSAPNGGSEVYAILCNASGAVNISGGTVSSGNSAVSFLSGSGATVTISGTANVSGGSATNSTIKFNSSDSAGKLTITGGTVRNTSTANTGDVIFLPTGTQTANIVVNITGGTISTSATSGYAVAFQTGNNANATVNIKTGVINASAVNTGTTGSVNWN